MERKAAPVVANWNHAPHRERAASLVAKHQRTVRQRSVQLRPRKPLPLTGGTLYLEHKDILNDILIAFILHTVP